MSHKYPTNLQESTLRGAMNSLLNNSTDQMVTSLYYPSFIDESLIGSPAVTSQTHMLAIFSNVLSELILISDD